MTDPSPPDPIPPEPTPTVQTSPPANPHADVDVDVDGPAWIGVRELRNQVAQVLRRAQAGERLIITSDGRPVAQIGPIRATSTPTLADLVAAGRLTAPAAGPAGPGEPTVVDLPVDLRIDDVIAERRGLA